MSKRRSAVKVFFFASCTLLLCSSAPGQPAGFWSAQAPAPMKRTEVAVAALGNQVVVAGGFGRLGVTGTVEAYDATRDHWRKIQNLPTGIHHAGMAEVGGRLYVVGGFTGVFSWKPSRAVHEYDPATDRWIEKSPMPTARGALAVAVHDDRIYAVGGFGNGVNYDRNERYDPATDQWETLAAMPTARDHLAATVIGGHLHAIGGRLESSYARNLPTHEVYDIENDRWENKPPLPTPRSGIAAAALSGKIFVFGGEAPEGTFNENEMYDPETGTWRSMAPLPTARHGLGAATLGMRIFVVAGGPRPGGSFSNVNEAFQLDHPPPVP